MLKSNLAEKCHDISPVKMDQKKKIKVAILGGGPSSLFVLKRLIESDAQVHIDMYERKSKIGAGMPYSEEGANVEHITNVSDNEIPEIVSSIKDWIKTVPEKKLAKFNIIPDDFSRYHVLPRLLFGEYLSAQFTLLSDEAKKVGIPIRVHTGVTIVDIIDEPDKNSVRVETEDGEVMDFDAVVICTGHNWPKKNEGKVSGFYDSPYPPSKLQIKLNHPVAVKGSSLTAIDAIRTLARANGTFEKDENEKLKFVASKESEKFRIVMHSRNGLLPAIRFHLEEPQLSSDSLLTPGQVEQNRKENGGFISLDYLFDKNFKEGFKKKDPKFYKQIKDMSMEEFVENMMSMRQGKEPFELFREEYREAEKSIEKRQSIFWKEMLAELSYTMNYPAKYMSAEDMLRLKEVLMPLISMVIAFVPQSSCEELFALHDAGKLDIVSVGSDSSVEPDEKGGAVYKYTDEQKKSHKVRYKTYVDCSGQPHLDIGDLPFKSLRTKGSVSQAVLKFKSAEKAETLLKEGNKLVVQNNNGDYFLKVSGIAINDNFQIVNDYGMDNERVYIMAVPYMGGYNPDYSGLDFSEVASACIVEKLTHLIEEEKFGQNMGRSYLADQL